MKKLFLFFTLLSLAACQPENKSIHGYIEGEFVLIAPTTGGLLETLSVERGQKVEADSALFSLDLTELTAQRDAAAASARKAQAELDDLIKGERPEEIEIILKQKEQAQAVLVNARKEYNRILPLSKVGAASKSSRDSAKATLDSAKAKIEELDAQLKTANLGARTDKIEAARAAVESARNTLTQTEKKLKEAAPIAPESGTIEDTFFRPGEYVAAGQPVVSLLPPENVKIRFFVPQKTVAKLKSGQAIKITCDGCTAAVDAKISYIAPEAEYTPPVIYSVDSRQKLVFLIEAKPQQFHPEFRPGLPVDIDLEL